MDEEVQGMLEAHRRARFSRVPAYLLLCLGGVVLWIDPTRNVEPIPWAIRWIWASLVVIPSAASMVGAIKDWWIAEFVSLPVVMAAFIAFVLVLVLGGGSTGRLTVAFWLGAIVVMLWRRWKGLWKFVRLNRRGQESP
jgi:hypothetical protein